MDLEGPICRTLVKVELIVYGQILVGAIFVWYAKISSVAELGQILVGINLIEFD